MKLRALVTIGAVAGSGLLAGCNPCSKESGQICTFVGTGKPGLGGENLSGPETSLYLPTDLTVGPDGRVYLLDWNNHRVRVMGEDGKLQTMIGTGELGDAPDGPALATSLNHPTHIAFDHNGELVMSAWHNSKVMRYDADTEELATICGTGKRSFSGDNGPAMQADLDLPVSVAFRADGAMYIADQANARIRLVDPAGVISTVVGTGEHGYGGDDGPATQAMLQAPKGQAASPAGKIALDADGNLFIADSGNNRIRRVDAQTGIITTVAGVGGTAGEDTGSAGDGGPAKEAQLARPTDVAIGPDGSLFIADTDNSCIRKVDPSGIITTVAGICGQEGAEGDHGKATEANLTRPFGIEVDKDGVLYIADTYNHRIRVVYP